MKLNLALCGDWESCQRGVKSSRESRLFAIQVEKRLETSQKTNAAALMGSKSDCVEGIPNAISQEVQESTNERANEQQDEIVQVA